MSSTQFRGAPMGKPSFHNFAKPNPRLYLRRIKLDCEGYDSEGTYWGLGAPLYWAGERNVPGNSISFYFRLRFDWLKEPWQRRDHAKRMVRELYPQCSFYR